MDKEELMIAKRLVELSKLADRRGIAFFSDFLNLHELNILHTIPKSDWYAPYQTFGGYDYAERQMVMFLPDALCYEQKYPFSLVKIQPLHPKYAEELSHRDYLGAIMHLGVERSRFGDLLLQDDGAYVFVCDSLVSFLCENLCQVRHTSVTAGLIEEDSSEGLLRPKTEIRRGTVASVRLDTVLSVAYPLSRSRLTAYIESGRVFVNGKLITNNGYRLKEEDLISVRGLGKLKYMGTSSVTRKGRTYIEIEVFI